jgi:hypothetical protein
VKVDLIRNHKVTILARKGRTIRDQPMAHHLAHVEETGKQIAAKRRAEDPGPIGRQSAGGRGTKMGHRGHQFAGARKSVYDSVPFRIDAPVNRMNQSIPPAIRGHHQKGGREKGVPCFSKGHVHRIVHAAGGVGFETTPIWTSPKYVRGGTSQAAAITQFEIELCKGTLGPVNPARRTQVGTVQIVGTSSQGATNEPLCPPIGHPVAISVLELPNAGRSRAVDRAVVPEQSFGKHHLVREHDALVVDAISIDIRQADNPVRPLRQLLLDLVIHAGRVCDVEMPGFVAIGHDRPVDERRSGHQFDLESRRQGEGVLANLDDTLICRFDPHLAQGDGPGDRGEENDLSNPHQREDPTTNRITRTAETEGTLMAPCSRLASLVYNILPRITRRP